MKIKNNKVIINFFKILKNKKLFTIRKSNDLLLYAMEDFNYPLFKLALICGADPNINVKTKANYHIVTRCARSGDVLLLKTLLEFGGNVNAENMTGIYLPIHIAASKGMTDTIILLYEYGADINAKYKVDENNYWTPLICAAKENKTNTVIKLIELGANKNDVDENKRTFLDLALKFNNIEIINFAKNNL